MSKGRAIERLISRLATDLTLALKSNSESDREWDADVTVLERLTKKPSQRTQRLLLIVGAVIFLAGGWIAARSLGGRGLTLDWGWLLVATGVGVPTSIAANILEYRLSGRLVDLHVPFKSAVRVTLLTTAANLLPLPGGAIVRVHALRSAGSSYRRATLTTAVVGFAWVGVALLVAGVTLLNVSAPLAAGLLAAGSGTLGLPVVWSIRRLTGREKVVVAVGLIGIELLAVLATALRFYFLLKALGGTPSAAAVAMLALASVLASAVGVFPGGLGIKELLAALFSPVVGIESALGFAAAALNRAIGLVVHAPLALGVSLTTPDDTSAPPVSTKAEPDDQPTGGSSPKR